MPWFRKKKGKIEPVRDSERVVRTENVFVRCDECGAHGRVVDLSAGGVGADLVVPEYEFAVAGDPCGAQQFAAVAPVAGAGRPAVAVDRGEAGRNVAGPLTGPLEPGLGLEAACEV